MSLSNDTDFKSFIDRQFTLLAHEQDAEIERSALLISNCSHTLLEQKGLALGGLGIVNVAIGLGGKSLIELERPSAYHSTTVFPPHTLRPGDLARIDEYASANAAGRKGALSKSKTSANDAGKSVEGVVYKVSDTRIVLAVSPSAKDEELDIPERCSLIKLANTVTHDRMRRAMEHLQRLILPDSAPSKQTDRGPRISSGPNALHRVLLGLSMPTNIPPAAKSQPTVFFDSSLNPSQISAVRFALGSLEVACIHGPPGTGKTRVLVEVIRQLVYAPETASNLDGSKKPMKILVCGASNLAVDNILERLSIPVQPPSPVENVHLPGSASKSYPPITLTRLGHPARIMSSLYSRTLDFQSQASDEAALAKDVKAELEEILASLSGKGAKGSKATGTRGGKPGSTSRKDDAGRSGVKKGQRLRGEARREAWQNVKELRKEYRKREEGVVRSVLSKAEVALATCHGAGSRQLQNMEFDVVVIDEATQALEAVCWIPVLKAKKLILAGDPMQLGPTIISEGNRRHARDKATKLAKQAIKTTMANSPKDQTQQTVTPKANSGSEENDGVSSGSSSADSGSDSSSPEKLEENRLVSKSAGTNPVGGITSKSLLRPPKTLGTTMFERLELMYGQKIKRMLDVQYRMNAKIATFPSKTLYNSRLTSHVSNATHLLRDLPDVSQDDEFEDVVGPGSEVVFWDTAGAEYWERGPNEREDKVFGDDGGSIFNENEAEVVKRWVHRLVAAGVKPSQIAIITPYQAQSQLLSTMLPQPGLEIGTADGMQGRENEAIVLSLVRSNPEGNVGFLKERRRLNVAMTRAKRHLCIVGDSATIRRGGGSYLKKWMDFLEKEADVRFAGDV
ncbi:P-loop containing nucleoside triphosphate hydrolase protein [Hysterangium stoloniferum]|nr:P-loop containing nucleoside triphosphate hydrolase protein [Hysterangium stoloniferum]